MSDLKVLYLNDEQEKAFKSLERAYKKCKKANIEFFVVLETLHAVNGNYVSHCDISNDYCGNDVNDCIDMSNSISDSGFCGYADDTHYVKHHVYEDFPEE